MKKDLKDNFRSISQISQFKRCCSGIKTTLAKKCGGFSLGEVLIALGIIGVLALILLPIYRAVKPNDLEVMHKKSSYIVERIVNELTADEYLYPKNGEFNGLANLDSVVVDGEAFAGPSKFCNLFAKRLTKLEGTEVQCADSTKVSVTSAEGIDWYLPIGDFKTVGFITVDVNGAKGPNKLQEDRFQYQVQPGYQVPVVPLDPDFGAEPPEPPTLPLAENDINTIPPDDRIAQTKYDVRVNITDGSSWAEVQGAGEKVNGQYQLVMKPHKGYTCDWLTKQVTVKDNHITIDNKCYPDDNIPEGEKLVEVTEPPPLPGKTYCITAIDIANAPAGKCSVEGAHCGYKNGKHEVKFKSNDKDYTVSRPSALAEINNKDAQVEYSCNKKQKQNVTMTLITNCGNTQVVSQAVPLSYTSDSRNPVNFNATSANLSKSFQDNVGAKYSLNAPTSAQFCDAENFKNGACVKTPQTCTLTSWLLNTVAIAPNGTLGNKAANLEVQYHCDRCAAPANYKIEVVDNIVQKYTDANSYTTTSTAVINTNNQKINDLSYSMTGTAQNGSRTSVTISQGVGREYWLETKTTCESGQANCHSVDKQFNPSAYEISIGNTSIYNQPNKARGKTVEYQQDNYVVSFTENYKCEYSDGTSSGLPCKPPTKKGIKIVIGSPLYAQGAGSEYGYPDPSANATGNTVHVSNVFTDTKVSPFSVVPEDTKKPWRVEWDDMVPFVISNDNGTGSKNFDVTLSANHLNDNHRACFYAEYNDHSAKSETVCIRISRETDATLRINWEAKGYSAIDVNFKMNRMAGAGAASLAQRLYATSASGSKTEAIDEGQYNIVLTDAKAQKKGDSTWIDVSKDVKITPNKLKILPGNTGEVNIKLEGKDPCDPINTYKIQVKEICKSDYCAKQGNGNPNWFASGGPYWGASNPNLNRDGTANIKGGSPWKMSYGNPSLGNLVSNPTGLSASIKRVTVNGKEVSIAGYNEPKVCENKDMVIEYDVKQGAQQTCNIAFEMDPDSSMPSRETAMYIKATGKSIPATTLKLQPGDTWQSLIGVPCDSSYNFAIEKCTTNGNDGCNYKLSLDPTSIKNVYQIQRDGRYIVYIKSKEIKNDSITISYGSLGIGGGTGYSVPQYTASGDNIKITNIASSLDSFNIGDFKVTPSNPSKYWKLSASNSGSTTLSTDGGTGSKNFGVTFSKPYKPTCVSATYSDGTGKSNEICFSFENAPKANIEVRGKVDSASCGAYGNQFISDIIELKVNVNGPDKLKYSNAQNWNDDFVSLGMKEAQPGKYSVSGSAQVFTPSTPTDNDKIKISSFTPTSFELASGKTQVVDVVIGCNAVPTHTLRVNYYKKGTTVQLQESKNQVLPEGADYSETAPSINGYLQGKTSDGKSTVSGKMPKYDLTVDFYYEPKPNNLYVDCKDYYSKKILKTVDMGIHKPGESVEICPLTDLLPKVNGTFQYEHIPQNGKTSSCYKYTMPDKETHIDEIFKQKVQKQKSKVTAFVYNGHYAYGQTHQFGTINYGMFGENDSFHEYMVTEISKVTPKDTGCRYEYTHPLKVCIGSKCSEYGGADVVLSGKDFKDGEEIIIHVYTIGTPSSNNPGMGGGMTYYPECNGNGMNTR